MGVSLSLPIILSKKGLIYFEFTNIFLEVLFKSFSKQSYPLYMRVPPPLKKVANKKMKSFDLFLLILILKWKSLSAFGLYLRLWSRFSHTKLMLG